MSGSQIDRELVFDLGLHKGFDAEFYLSKGFRVVGVEASPDLYHLATERCVRFGADFIGVNMALAEQVGTTATFYTVPDKDDWGSLSKDMATKGLYEAVPIEVETIDLPTLFERYGTPHYVKCDLEGGDAIFLEQLEACGAAPPFVSVEMSRGDEGARLARCGYEVGQLVNQWMNPFKRPPEPAREGRYAPAVFHAEMSGLFGRELPPSKWRPIGEIDELYGAWKRLRDMDEELAPGWVDLHVCRRSEIDG